MTRIISFLVLVHVCSKANCQDELQIAKNYLGVNASLIFDDISIAPGIEYERQIFSSNKFVFAVSAARIFKYKSGNANIILGPNDNITSSHWQIWANGYWFTSGRAEGFFIRASLGMTGTKRIQKNISPPAETIIKKGISPGTEAGFGFHIRISNRNAIRISGTGAVFFPSNQNESFSILNEISFKASFGF